MNMTSLSKLLEEEGYIRIALSRSGVGHFHTEGTLNGHSVSVLIDTGANTTIVNLDVVHRLGLEATKLAGQGAGAGSASLDVYELTQASLVLSGISPAERTLLAMDLSHAIQALESSGFLTPIDAILGVDALDAHSAVIDYGSDSLFLKILPE